MLALDVLGSLFMPCHSLLYMGVGMDLKHSLKSTTHKNFAQGTSNGHYNKLHAEMKDKEGKQINKPPNPKTSCAFS